MTPIRSRRLVTSAFTPQRIGALRPAIRRIADELLDALTVSSGPADPG